MPDVKGLLSDPEFQRLDLPTRKMALGRLDPELGKLSDQDFQAFSQRLSGPPQFGLTPPPGYVPSKPDLPPDLPQRVGRLAVRALPYAGATAAALLAPEVVGPAGIGTWLANMAIPVAAAGVGAGVGSGLERGVRSIADMPPPDTTVMEDVVQKGVLPEMGGRILTSALGKIFNPMLNPKRMYQSSLKPVGAPEKAERAVLAGLEEGIVPGEAAANIARERIGKLNTQIEGIISGTPSNIPATQYVSRVQGKLDNLRRVWGRDATHGADFVDKIDDLERRFLLDHGNVPPARVQTPTGTVIIKPEDMSLAELRASAQPLSAADAQAIKKQTYETIRTGNAGAWESGAHPGLSVRVNKEVAKALKEELQQIYPEIAGLNAREGALIGLEGQLQRFTKREMNRQVLPYFIFPTAGALVGAAGHGPSGAAGGAGLGAVAGHLLRSALEDPGVKARIAIALYRTSQNAVMGTAGRAIRVSLPADIRMTELGLRKEPEPTPIQPVLARR